MNFKLILTIFLSVFVIGSVFPEVKTYTYKTVVGHEIKADVHRPPHKKILPAVIFMHGGACIWGSRVNRPPRPLRDKLLEAGYVVVSIDYRLAPETKLDEIIKDVEDAYTWVREKGPLLFSIDPDRIAVMGGSAGGYLTLMAGWRVTPPPWTLVAISGYGDLAWYGTPPGNIPENETKKAYAAVGDKILSNGRGERASFYRYCREYKTWIKEVADIDPAKAPKIFDRLRPIMNVTAKYPPTLLVHAKRDEDVPYTQARKMKNELDNKRVENELITLEEGHSSGLIKKYPEVSDTIVGFLNKHMTRSNPSKSPAGSPQYFDGRKGAVREDQNYGNFKAEEWTVQNTKMSIQDYKGKKALRLDGQYALAYLRDIAFEDGTIECDITAPGKGNFYLGVAFRVREEVNKDLQVSDNSRQKYEYIYFRPFASGTRNAIQYCAAGTKYNWSYLRENHPGVYEARADIPEVDWFHVRIVVSGLRAEVYVNDSRTPNLVVKDLKHGLSKGSVGVYSYHKEAYFANFTVIPTRR